ncbi:hypothetical protein [Cesiribacter andamanensis]|nr:hypothetical protein [Cesiribacter andamanensis]
MPGLQQANLLVRGITVDATTFDKRAPMPKTAGTAPPWADALQE